MLTTFLDKLSGFFDQRFIVAYWMPAFIGLLLSSSLVVVRDGLAAIGSWWDGQTATQQWLIGLSLLFIVSMAAYILQALTIPLVRLYEGYWPRWLTWLQRWAENRQRRVKQRVKKQNQDQGGGTQRTLYYSFPHDDKQVLATRLGNTMRAAEEYPYLLYRIDAIIWWPRLAAILPERLRSQVDGAFVPVIALLNLCTLFGLWALGGGAVIALTDQRRWLFALIFASGLALAWVCYRAAITQAEDYGDLVRVAFDLHRHEVLQKLHIAVPDNLSAERILWYKLGQLHYHHIFPWDLSLPTADTQLPETPFYYDTHKPESPEPKPQAINVNVKGLSTTILRRRRGP